MFKDLEYIFALVSGWLCIYHPFLHWKWEGINKGKLREDLGSGNEGGGVLWGSALRDVRSRGEEQPELLL